jgi:hypothetical protein
MALVARVIAWAIGRWLGRGTGDERDGPLAQFVVGQLGE